MKLVATETAYKGNDLYVKEYQVQMEKTLRDEFAMAALQGITANDGAWGDQHIEEQAKKAYQLADAMMKDRSK